MNRNCYTSITLLVLLASAGAVSQPAFNSWTYYREIALDNTGNTQTLTDYSVLVVVDTKTLITQGKMKADGSDIRFTTDFTNDLAYWIEPGIQNEFAVNKDGTHIWVKVPNIAGSSNSTLYMVYGNSSAAAKSNIQTTFLFGDDFDDNSFDTNRWETVITAQGQVNEQNQRLEHNSPASFPESEANVHSKQTFTEPVVLEMRFKKGGYVYRGVGLTGTSGPADNNRAWFDWQDWGQIDVSVTVADIDSGYVFGDIYHNNENKWSASYNPEYYLKLIRDNDGSLSFFETIPSFEVDGYKHYEHKFYSVNMPLTTPLMVWCYEHMWRYGAGSTRYEDDIRVRKYSSPEPITLAGSEYYMNGTPTTTLPGEYKTDANTVLLLHMNETSGDTAKDASGQNNKGTAFGTTVMDGRFGKARSFNGTSNFIDLSESASLTTFTNKITFEAWIYSNNFNGGSIIATGNQSDYAFSVQNNNKIRVDMYGIDVTGKGAFISKSTLSLNTWHHLAVICDGLKETIFIDGRSDTSRSATENFATSPQGEDIRIGSYAGSTPNFFNGLIDEVRISNIARSPNEFNLQLPPKNLSASPLTASIDLTWQNGGGAVPLMKYYIYRGADSTTMSKIDSTSQISYSNTGVSAGTTYYYRVSAVDSTGFEGARSFAVNAKIQNGAWETKTSLPVSRSASFSAVVNGLMYVMGGHNGTSDDAAVYSYDPASNGWTPRTSMPGGRYQGSGCVTLNGKIYVIGGWSTSPGLPNSNLWMYDPVPNSWGLKASLPTLSADGVAGVIAGKIYVSTAANGSSGYRNYLHVYDPSGDSWTGLTNSTEAHSTGFGGAINGKFYLGGGMNSSGSAITTMMEEYDPLSNSWTQKSPVPYYRTNSSSVVYNNKLYVIGGSNGSAVIDTVLVYDPALDMWEFESSMPTPRVNTTAGIINGTIYVVGGVTTSAPLATNEAYTLGAIPVTTTLGEYIPDANTVLLLHMNEGHGTTVSDASGQNNNGNATGTAVVNGKFGKARSFGTSSNYIMINDASSLRLQNNFSVEAWIYPTTNGNAQIISKGNDATAGWVFYLNGAPNYNLVFAYWGIANYEVNEQFPRNIWSHVSAIFDGTYLRLYINGVLKSTYVTGFPNISTANIRIGTTWANESFDGQIDEVRISNTARSPEEFNLQLSPTILTWLTSTSSVYLTWQNGGGAVPLMRYRIYRGADSTTMSRIDSTSQTSYSNSGLAAGATYYYRISAVDSTGFEGAKSFAVKTTVIDRLTEGLVAYYPFNDNANDESGNGNDGIFNTATPTTDRFGNMANAYSFTGTDSRIEVPNSPSLNPGTAITIAAWVNVSASTGDHQVVVGKWYGPSGPPDPSYLFELQPNGNIIQMPISGVTSDTYSDASSSEAISFNEWHFVAGTYDGAEVTIYVDSTVKCKISRGGNIQSTNTPLIIGAHNSPIDRNPFNGRLDDIRIYNRALTEDEIDTLYHEGGWMKSQNPAIALSASSFAFGSVTPGTSSKRTLIITNNGGATLTGSVSITANQGFTIDKISISVPAGRKDSIQITFSPNAAQDYNATLVIAHNASQNASVINLSGTGRSISSGADISLSKPGILVVSNGNFAGTTIATITITNNGNVNLTGTASYSGSSVLSISGSALNVAPFGSHVISLLIGSPSVAVGIYEGTITITHNAPGGSTTIPVEVRRVSIPATINISKNIFFGDPEKSSNYKLIGLPGMNAITPSSVMGGEYKKDWRIYRDNGQPSNFLEEYDGTTRFNFGSGKGFWILAKNGISLSLSTQNYSNAAAAYPVMLQNGWNIISNPFERSVQWGDVITFNALPSNAMIYTWNGGTWAPASVMTLYEAYYYQNTGNAGSLLIPYDPFGSFGNKLTGPEQALPVSGRCIAVSIESDGQKISTAYAGFDSTSGSDFDNNDYFAPPSSFAASNITIENKKLSTMQKRLFIEHRKEIGQGEQFDLVVKNNSRAQTILKIDGIGGFSSENVFLYDEQRGMAFDLAQTGTIAVPRSENEQRYRLLIGSDTFVKEVRSKILPNEFSLYQNYPNPFNPATTISYYLPAASQVRITVYDMLGREVRTAVNEFQQNGYYALPFEGRNLASGVYYYRLQAGNFVSTKKMLLLK